MVRASGALLKRCSSTQVADIGVQLGPGPVYQPPCKLTPSAAGSDLSGFTDSPNWWNPSSAFSTSLTCLFDVHCVDYDFVEPIMDTVVF